MKTISKLAMALVIGLLSAQTWAAANEPERIMGVKHDRTGLTFQVMSNGCTEKEDFELLQQETYPAKVFLIRKTPDYCRAFVRYGVEIHFTWEELGNQPFYLGNELGMFVPQVLRF
jgi:hypothetical protein